jgi:predicted ATPase
MEAKTLKEVLQEQNLTQKLSLQEVAANYSHIELTADEELTAIINAKIAKEKQLKAHAQALRIAENRKRLICTTWDFDQTKGYMLSRAPALFANRFDFKLDEHNKAIFNLLCYYFSEDRQFVSMASNMGINNPSLDKGIFLTGNFGVGKTVFMELFKKNKRQVFHQVTTKEVALHYQHTGEYKDEYVDKFTNAFEDISVFGQRYAGICFEDLGTEDAKNSFGNKANVIGDILEIRYARGNVGVWMHATTNLTAQQVGEYYGARVQSRLREVMNFIELPGADRRK